MQNKKVKDKNCFVMTGGRKFKRLSAMGKRGGGLRCPVKKQWRLRRKDNPKKIMVVGGPSCPNSEGRKEREKRP